MRGGRDRGGDIDTEEKGGIKVKGAHLKDIQRGHEKETDIDRCINKVRERVGCKAHEI